MSRSRCSSRLEPRSTWHGALPRAAARAHRPTWLAAAAAIAAYYLAFVVGWHADPARVRRPAALPRRAARRDARCWRSTSRRRLDARRAGRRRAPRRRRRHLARARLDRARGRALGDRRRVRVGRRACRSWARSRRTTGRVGAVRRAARRCCCTRACSRLVASLSLRALGAGTVAARSSCARRVQLLGYYCGPGCSAARPLFLSARSAATAVQLDPVPRRCQRGRRDRGRAGGVRPVRARACARVDVRADPARSRRRGPALGAVVLNRLVITARRGRSCSRVAARLPRARAPPEPRPGPRARCRRGMSAGRRGRAPRSRRDERPRPRTAPDPAVLARPSRCRRGPRRARAPRASRPPATCSRRRRAPTATTAPR